MGIDYDDVFCIPPGLALVAAAVLVITTDESSLLFGQKTYPAAESEQRILLDTKSGLKISQ